MFYAHNANGFSQFFRLLFIGRQWSSVGHCAKLAAPGANVPQNHKGSGSPVPAFANIGTISTGTYCMQAMLFNQIFYLRIAFALWHFHLHPSRQSLPFFQLVRHNPKYFMQK
jgi:hypothetical protein